MKHHLASTEHPISQLVAKGEEKAKEWVHTGLDMLKRMRADVSSHLPKRHPSEPSALVDFVKSRTHDIKRPMEYVQTMLSQHLHVLQLPLLSYELRQGLAETMMPGLKPYATVHEPINLVLALKFVEPIARGKDGMDLSEMGKEREVEEITRALMLTRNAARLIDYEELPNAWKSNAFMTRGYSSSRLQPLYHLRLHQHAVALHEAGYVLRLPLRVKDVVLPPGYHPFDIPHRSTHSRFAYGTRQPRKEVPILKKSAEGELLMPDVKRADSSVSFGQLSLNRQGSGASVIHPGLMKIESTNSSGVADDDLADEAMSLDFKPRKSKSPPMSATPW
ncbi:hypothetical protein BDY19DRAFT_996895 [Irpex rosettiformis]|uniref:Uncharacterized protein n=1 Tax=Irpex rosettiformis TaxID=378272 RepID=A0ACB8TTF7_9APHY|nr:hypothetical protein BDY19DRAFT_996895 [Irpex rosettiformis]